MHFKVVYQTEKYVHLALSGRLDMAGVREIEIPFAEHTTDPNKSILLDMTEVSFVASMGLRMLLSAAKKIHSGNGKIILINTNTMIKEVLKLAGIESLLNYAANETEAVGMI